MSEAILCVGEKPRTAICDESVLLIMEWVELFSVKDSFFLERNGPDLGDIILLPDFSVPAGGWQDRTIEVTIIRPDAQKSLATANVCLTHLNIADPMVTIDRRWRISVVLKDQPKGNVTPGCGIAVPREIQTLLL